MCNLFVGIHEYCGTLCGSLVWMLDFLAAHNNLDLFRIFECNVPGEELNYKSSRISNSSIPMIMCRKRSKSMWGLCLSLECPPNLYYSYLARNYYQCEAYKYKIMDKHSRTCSSCYFTYDIVNWLLAIIL